jgi:hypothetical protein
MDDPDVTRLTERLLRQGYFDDETDARRTAKSLLESVVNMIDHEDGETAGR